MMNLKRMLALVASVIVLFASCTKFLDQNPNSIATDQTTWQSDNDANASVAAGYSLLRAAFNASITYYTYGDLVSDEFSDVVAGDVGSYQNIQRMVWNISVPAANPFDPRLKLRVYSNFYAVIAQANRCLYFLQNMPVSAFTGSDEATKETKRNKYLGEAYFLRAYSYYYLSQIWGDVPLALTYNADVSNDPQLPRSPQATVLAQAIADAKLAKAYLYEPDASSSDRAVRADKGAAFALLAHIYAWKGDYDSCALSCDSVMNFGYYSLTDSTSFSTITKGQSSEGIFEIASNRSTESQNATDAYSWTGVMLVPAYINNFATQPAWQISTSLVGSLYSDTTDIRYRAGIRKLSQNTLICVKYANIQNISSLGTTFQVALNNIIVFRLADITLLKAEALAAKSVPDPAGALALVNTVRIQRGLPTISGLVSTDLIKTIFDERGRELFMEGHRFFDLIRLERLTGEAQLPYMTHEEFLAGKYYWPVDPSLFLTNSRLTQTPFWVGKLK